MSIWKTIPFCVRIFLIKEKQVGIISFQVQENLINLQNNNLFWEHVLPIWGQGCLNNNLFLNKEGIFIWQNMPDSKPITSPNPQHFWDHRGPWNLKVWEPLLKFLDKKFNLYSFLLEGSRSIFTLFQALCIVDFLFVCF